MRIRAVLPGCALLAALALSASPAGAEEGPRPRGTIQWVDPGRDLSPDAVESNHISNLIFINRCVGDCTVTPGQNDARYNTSSIPDGTSVISEFEHGDEVFQQVVDCVREVYAPYNVEITTTDPGESMLHHEAILAGHPSEIGQPSIVGGIAPASCDPLNNVISFSFANLSDPDVEEMCWTVAQESAHAFGLPNHVFNCLDPMTYIPNCGRKYFRNKDYPCGEQAAGDPPCRCGDEVQNSHEQLRDTFGDGVQPPPPEVTFLSPEEEASVQQGFSIYVDAQDPRLVERLELWINGSQYGEKQGHDWAGRLDDYYFIAPDLPDGYLDIEIRAYNDLGSEGVATLRVLKGEPCSSADACFDHQECVEGACVYPPPEGELGDSCDYRQYCESGICPTVQGERACSQICNPSVSGDCPDGFECLEADGAGICWPKGKYQSGGGCHAVAGGDGNIPWGVTLIFAGILVATRFRAGRRQGPR